MNIEETAKALITALTEKESANDRIDLLTYREACELLKVSRWTLHRWIKQGKIQALKLGKSKNSPVRICADSLLAYLGTTKISGEAAV